ncbi:MAG: tetratricopeptide repeat protein [Alphaproteobacteria bacterium]|nr:tetratricopeptide repeat protein [Alphaproteobacteria bacterium]MBV9967561.1 tetratricopeptide repeat protein [Alphaproteobacteria bacterium]
MALFSRRRRQPSLITRADRAREAGQWQLAADFYRQALDRNPANAPIWIQYGHALKECGSREAAEAAYHTAIRYRPHDAEAYLQLGHVLKLQGKMSEAQAAYRRALTLDGSLADATRELGELEQGERGRGREERLPGSATQRAGDTFALIAFDSTALRRQLRRSKGSFISRADRARDAHQWDIAADFYRQALDRDPSNASIWVQYGHALKQSGDFARAQSAYRAAIFRDPSAADPYLHLAHVLKLEREEDQARAAYLGAAVRDPQLPQPFDELRGLGWSDEQLAELRHLTRTHSLREPQDAGGLAENRTAVGRGAQPPLAREPRP